MPVVALLEGGYAVDALGANAVAFLGALGGTDGGSRRHDAMHRSVVALTLVVASVGLSACGGLLPLAGADAEA